MTAIVEAPDNPDDKYRQQVGKLYRENREMLYRKARRIIGNHHDAEEALHTAFMNLIERPWPMDVIKNPVGYLVKATRNAALDAVRLRASRLLTHVLFEDQQILAPQKDSKVGDRFEQIRLALAEMKPRLVDTLDLCCMEGLTCKKVAKIRGRAFGTVAADLFRAKLEVRRLIRIQEKKDEAQKNERQRISGPGLADPSAT
jgi:RNA polymerase sigma factor (sigma-70 family)